MHARSMPLPAYLFSLVLFLLLVLASCGGNATPSSDQEPPAEESTATTDESRGTLRVSHEMFMGGAENLDPASTAVFLDVLRLLYDTLVAPGANYEPLPALATTWESNDDATVWTFTLRDDVQFHDGSPFTSADVVYTFERILGPESESLLSIALSLIERIEAPDAQTVVFHLSKPHADLPVLFSVNITSIIPVNSGETIGTTGIGTGPFKLDQLDPASTTRLVANDSYWRGTPGLAAIEVIGIAHTNARIQALQAGQIDLVNNLSPQEATLLEDNADIIMQQLSAGTWFGLLMLTDVPPFDDVRVRQALRLVVDRQLMIDLLLQGKGRVVCDNLIWTGDPYYWAGTCPQDIDRAKDLLAEAGYPDGLDVTLYTSSSFGVMIPLAEVYQQQAALAGITVTIEQAPPDTYWTDVWLVEPLIIGGDGQYIADLLLNRDVRAESPWNETRWYDAETEQLLDAAQAELDPDQRTALYQQVQQRLAEEGGRVIGFQMDELRAFASSVAGIEPVSRWDLLWYEVTKTE